MSRTTPTVPATVAVPVNRVRHAVAGAMGWGRPTDTGLALAVAGALYPPAGPARAPEVPTPAAAERTRRPTTAHAARRARRRAVRR